ncbi:transposase [Natronococcus jeotgali DSM 18795]|uniref:Transposase n=1 Tax=Natronococcus jeotgali DSM 18795 TaxID=1227498 RepID=L9XRF6_9EURY|nr:transposase [Natronococcus jeotgali DSM 18795]
MFQWVHWVAAEAPDPPTAKPSRVTVDETVVTIGTERHWLYAAIDVESKLLLNVWLSPRRGTDPAVEFLGRLAENHDLSEATFLVDGMGYLTALARCDLRGHLDYVDRSLIERWFQTLAMRIDRFHQTWMKAASQRPVLAHRLRPLLQPATTESSARESNSRRGRDEPMIRHCPLSQHLY